MTIEPRNGNCENTGTPCSTLPLSQRVEALLFASERSLSETKIKTVLGIEDEDATKQIKEAIDSLNKSYDGDSRAFCIERIAGGYRVMTREELAPLVSRLHEQRQQQKLSQAALETLSIISYRQPVMRAEIEVIRGVACGEVLRGLMERRLVKIVGRAEELGRPMLYGTTKDFLTTFGLANLKDLPEVQGLVREPSWKPARPNTSDSPESSEAPEASSDSEEKQEQTEVSEQTAEHS
ncbi:MAG: SMC-Scp complex subunit ScpB [Phycisphaerales bacterium]|jgi:segregation and condensation protein B|nr:SMC-Scp complex subunit ScpB [Phycisphaerales bacterium]